MSSWRYSSELVSRELDLAKKKKKALDDLYAAGKISQSTYEYIEKDLTEVIIDLEAHLKTLIDRMKTRAEELEKQMKSLEIFLANLEMHYVAGEIDEETYTNQNKAIILGLNATKQELETIKDALSKIVPEKPELEVEEKAPEKPPEEEKPEPVVEEKPTEEKEEEQLEVQPAPESAETTEMELPTLLARTEEEQTQPITEESTSPEQS